MVKARTRNWIPPRFPPGKRLMTGVDQGRPITVPCESFAPPQRSGGWGPHADSFLRFNHEALKSLDVTPVISNDSNGLAIKLLPGQYVGAVPIRSSLTGEVAGGLIIKPRFDWTGIGQVLNETGWSTVPKFLETSQLVPGSAREIPPWVIAGPVLKRLEELLQNITPGFNEKREILTKPKGRINWPNYVRETFVRGKWHHVPCTYPVLETDSLLLRNIRWALERVYHNLLGVGGRDYFTQSLAVLAIRLLESLQDVIPLAPTKERLNSIVSHNRLFVETVRRGIEAISWIVDERGMGGGNERDGLAWVLSLNELWEKYVVSVYKRELSSVGAEIRVGYKGETVFPLNWANSSFRTMSHLTPDVVALYQNQVHIVDAKYKSHLIEVEESRWYEVGEKLQEEHRADLHQILAYAALFEATEIRATLVYPLRQSTYAALVERGKDKSIAELFHGGRRITLELRGIPFGGRVSPF